MAVRQQQMRVFQPPGSVYGLPGTRRNDAMQLIVLAHKFRAGAEQLLDVTPEPERTAVAAAIKAFDDGIDRSHLALMRSAVEHFDAYAAGKGKHRLVRDLPKSTCSSWMMYPGVAGYALVFEFSPAIDGISVGIGRLCDLESEAWRGIGLAVDKITCELIDTGLMPSGCGTDLLLLKAKAEHGHGCMTELARLQ